MSVFRVDCEIDGGLLVGDRRVLSDLSDEDLFSLMVAVDEQGRTDLAFDHPGERWPDVYLGAGACGLRLMLLSRQNAWGVRGEYGTQEHPAVLLQLEPSGEPGPDSSTENNFMGQNPAWLASWVRSEDPVSAVVKRIESEKAIFTISFPSGEGYAQAPLDSRQVSVGDRVLLRLLEKSGGRWEAEIAGPEVE